MATSCPNDCSGHGLCLTNGKCVCYRQDGLAINNANFEEFGYTNNDCSQRLCPKGPSHQYAANDDISQEISDSTYVMSIIDFTDTQDPYYQELRSIMPNYYFSYGKTIIYSDNDITELDKTHSGSVTCYYDVSLKEQYKTYQIYQIFKSTTTTYLIGNEVELPLIMESKSNSYIFGYNYIKQIPERMYCRIMEEYTDYSLYATFPITVPITSEVNEITFAINQKENEPPTNNYLSPVFYELTEKQQLLIDDVIDSNITFLCFDRFNKYHLHELNVKSTNNYIDLFNEEKHSITIETVKSDVLSSCFMLYSTIRHDSIPTTKDYNIFNMIGETDELGVLLSDSVMLPVDYDKSYKYNNKDNNEVDEYALVVDLTKVLSQIMKSNTGYGTPFSKRYTSLTEITNIMNIGSSAKLWYFPLNNQTHILPIQSQLLHIREIMPLENDDNLVKVRFYEKVINYVRNNEYNEYMDIIKLTGIKVDDYLISLQVFNSGPYSFIECSGVGDCNRENGLCKCQKGYEGIACERTACPNNCNGRGVCEVIESDANGYGYIHTQTRCKCDGGYRGSDCSLKECPSSEDPNKATNVVNDKDGEFRDCSGRGICDYTTGTCKCFNGFGGEGCGEVHSQF